MAVDQDRLGDRREGDREAARLRLARDELLEQERLRGDRIGLGAEPQRQRLVAQREQARRLEADDRHAGVGERQQRIEQRRGFALAWSTRPLAS